MNIRIPDTYTCYMRHPKMAPRRKRQSSLTINALVVTPESLFRPRLESIPLERVVRVVDPMDTEGGDEN